MFDVQPQPEQPQHEMVFVESTPSGAEEWSCPTCGRRFVVQWTPTYEKLVLDPGEKHVPHFGGRGGMRMGRIDLARSGRSRSDEFDDDID